MKPMTKVPRTILGALQARAARSALGPSSMRGSGHAGVVDAGRPFLAALDLRRFATSNERRFQRELDRQTDLLLHVFPRPARHWGLARKGLNIFLRDCLYTVYLRDAFRLALAESLFEIPLDSVTGRAIWMASGKRVPRLSFVTRRFLFWVSTRAQCTPDGSTRGANCRCRRSPWRVSRRSSGAETMRNQWYRRSAFPLLPAICQLRDTVPRSHPWSETKWRICTGFDTRILNNSQDGEAKYECGRGIRA